MNKPRRKELEKAIALLDQARYIIEEVKDEEQEAFDNMPENLQYSERGERMEEIIYQLEEYIDSLDEMSCSITDEIIEA